MDIRRRMLSKKKASSSGGPTIVGSYTVNLNSQWEATTAVPNPDSTLYDGVYRSSSNYNVNSGVSIMYITIKDCSSFKMYIRSYAESNYDYVMVSQLDKTINGNTTYSDTTLVKAHTRGNQQSGTTLSNYTLVEFTGISSGEHTITVVYRKDSSVNNGDDRGYVLIEKTQDGSGSNEGPINTDNYLTIEAREDGLTASLSKNACEYCVDGDGNWKTLSAGTATESINSGHTLSFRGEITPNNVYGDGIGTFTISKKCNLKGNCMSVLFGDDAADNYSLSGKGYAFYQLFNNCTNIVNVSENFLPATTLANHCYDFMFQNCTSLTTAPELPATTLANYCYNSMFYGCTSLTTAPELPATTLAEECYSRMFCSCTALTTAPSILPATILVYECYGEMFRYCTSLTTVPKVLPATTLENMCYYNMFHACTSLTTAPELPATTLANNCYYNMFSYCTNLTTAPELPATTLAKNCYRYMFDGCTKLNYIKMLATDISASNCLDNWVNGVASSGTFVKNPNMTTLPTGTSGIPIGWTVVIDIDNYLTIEALEDGLTASLSTNACEYCVDGDSNWKTLAAGTVTESINSGQTLSFRGNLTPASDKGIGRFTISKKCNFKGNCMSMLFGDEAADNYSLSGKNYAFYWLFQNCSNVINVSENFLPATTLSVNCYHGMFYGCSNLTTAPELPATILTDYCYFSMFRGCTSLTTAPELPATTLASYCYHAMFYGCSNLTTAPELPATTMADYCYDGMFGGCTSLTTAPELPATTLADYCYSYMFNGCTSLTTAPELPATTLSDYCYCNMFDGCTSLTTTPKLPATALADGCYVSMFSDCTSLTTAPELPATTLAPYCYGSMFSDCTSLTTAPELPATTLTNSCYNGMFYDCTSLTTAPWLPATTLTSYCYNSMFRGCTKLNYIKMLATDISASSCLGSWVDGVASSGTFVKNPNMTSLPTGTNGIPSGWTIVNDGEPIINTDNYLTIEAREDGLTASLSINDCEYCVDSDGIWKTLSANTVTETINSGQTLSFRGNLWPSANLCGIGTFTISKKCNLKGNCMSMLFKDNAADNYSLSSKLYAFGNLFKNCTNIVNVSNNFLPATILSDLCYQNMFYGCTNLTTAPELPATTLRLQCYCGMFSDCTSLTTAPELPATRLADRCYSGMFSDCTSLTTAPELPATTLADGCYSGMFSDCTSLTTAPELPATTLADSCYYSMFAHCTSLTTAPELPATTLIEDCYWHMFNGCTSLTIAPTLPAATLADYCYCCMFNDCTKLNYIKMLATDISAYNCLGSWVYNVATTGTFVKNPAMTSLPTGNDGIPRGWTVVNDGEPIINTDNYLTIEARENGLTASLSTNDCQYCIDGDGNWKALPAGTATESINSGHTLSFRGELTPTTAKGIGTFTISKRCNLKGNCMSMLFGDAGKDNYSLSGKSYAFYKLFENCTNIINVSSNFLPATTLAYYCYNFMFNGCTSLTSAPKLPSTTLTTNCYQSMFQNCTSLTTTPELPATTLASNCYQSMFYGCTNLRTAPSVLPATTLTLYCYNGIFNGCTSLTTAPALPATTLATGCYYYMFQNCKNLTTAPSLPATTLADYCYRYMFKGCTNLTVAPALPATTLTRNCYESMFEGCTSLITTPELPATTVADRCYYFMFKGCTNLTTAPTVLPATTLASNCYQTMFSNCINLTAAPALPATTLASNCYTYMFSNCTNLTTAPELPATTLADYCYSHMFNDCTSLTVAPALPATTLTTYCYSYMFFGCTSLATVPTVLPATTLADYCYYYMFQNCTSLTTAPELPATTLYKECYKYMFMGCKKLNYIKMMATDISASNCLNNWVGNVSSTGTFVKNPNMTTLPTGAHGIPSGWTVVNDGEPIINTDNYLTIESLEDGLIARLSINACEYCVDGDGNWKSLAAETATQSINSGHTLSFRGEITPATIKGIGTFTISKKCNLKGNCMSMLFGDNAANNFSLSGKSYAFYKLFENCTNIVNVSSNFLPAATLANYCYYYMFNGCTSLTTAPELPATTLASNCYRGMFNGCTSLTTVPELPATTLANSCYENMFYGCTSLVNAPELPATTVVFSCYNAMFYGCTSLTTAPELPATTLEKYCYRYMFIDCSNLNYIKMLATDISAIDCLHNWVSGVASSGTFVKHPNMTTLPTGDYGIPRGWTVVNDGEESSGNLITFYVADSLGVKPNFIEYTATEGMTWGEWIDSEYNTSDLYIDGEIVITSEGLGITSNSSGSAIRSSDVIINGEKYRRG